jgi:hypothetical protein
MPKDVGREALGPKVVKGIPRDCLNIPAQEALRDAEAGAAARTCRVRAQVNICPLCKAANYPTDL